MIPDFVTAIDITVPKSEKTYEWIRIHKEKTTIVGFAK